MTTIAPAALPPAVTPPEDPAGQIMRKSQENKIKPGLLGLSMPAIVWYIIFTIGPLFAMFYIALLSWSSLIAPSTFVGFKNFGTVFHDPVFWQATRNSIVQIAIVLPIMLPLAFMLGYYVSLKPRGHRVLRVILFTPALISLAAKSIIFLSIFAPTGLLNGFLDNVGLGALSTPWLASQSTALGTVMAVDLWSGIGFTAILFSARLSSIPAEVFEASELDGAGHWRRMWGIAYPICRDYFGVLLMLQFIWVLFGSAGSILLLTNGGPGSSSTTLSFLVYDKAFTQSQIGYSQAVGVILFAVGIVGMIAIRRVFRAKY
ncbi:carbohydrate ABC transporter permease [Subtercola lobariae]|uniref:Transporter n=1 Tax=Subtercola lobariae TaxID=1588641 RepID=A0A917EW76_9MICO|nr:sugar ABC transporter permease [Subtercola lobariae]GGF20831.1 transporter [Subtercola lobariae]